jgi:hypothetical protein
MVRRNASKGGLGRERVRRNVMDKRETCNNNTIGKDQGNQR